MNSLPWFGSKLSKILRDIFKMSTSAMPITCDSGLTSTKINHFVFFDLETTGFLDRKNMPRITELALLAVSRDSLEADDRLPRVLHKLVVLCNPKKSIPPIVHGLTNLNNEMLENEEEFTEDTLELIKMFLKRLKPPICFVAHNGNRFDYPLILHMCELIKKDFPPEILSIDSIFYFKHYFSQNNSPITDDSLSFPDDGLDQVIAALGDEIFSPNLDRGDVKVEISPWPNSQDHNYSMQKANEKTPTRNRVPIREFQNLSTPSNSKPKNYQLETIYKLLMNDHGNSMHMAENDCLALLKCCHKVRQDFFSWADINAKPLVQFKMR